MVDRIIRGLPADRFDRKITASRNFQSIGKPIPNAGLLQGVVGVGWSGGGVFVTSRLRKDEANGILQHLDAKNAKADLTLHNDGTSSFGSFGDAFCLAYTTREAIGLSGGNPSFVAVGARESDSTESVGIILHSSDAKTWTEVYSMSNNPTSLGTWVWCVVHDGAKFWAGAHDSNNGEERPDINEIDILLTSEDGRGWGEAGRNVINIDQWPSYVSTQGLIVPHLDNAFQGFGGPDGAAMGVPGGFCGVRRDKDQRPITKIRPDNKIIIDPLAGSANVGTHIGFPPVISPTSNNVLRNGDSISVGFPVSAVGYGGGHVWMAAGGSGDAGDNQAAVSFDDGKTWKPVTIPSTGMGGASGVVGGPFNLVRGNMSS